MVTICQNYITPIALVIALVTSIGRGYVTGAGLKMDLSPIIDKMSEWFEVFETFKSKLRFRSSFVHTRRFG
ncbi:MAG: hypothetical protein EOO63_06120 [Hymenobacter sp.]|nr:MAG: hypothetical protein EOO63_06120 [Hymenobacter sp.]